MFISQKTGVAIAVLLCLTAGLATAQDSAGLPKVRALGKDEMVLGDRAVRPEGDGREAYDIETLAKVLAGATIPLEQAVVQAEQRVAGKAIHAALDKIDGQWSYEIEVVADGTVFDVAIDAGKGQVLSATEKTVVKDGNTTED